MGALLPSQNSKNASSDAVMKITAFFSFHWNLIVCSFCANMSVVLPQCLYESARAMWLAALIIPVNPVLALIRCTFICRSWIGRAVAVCKSSESRLSQLIWSQLASADDGSVDFIVMLSQIHTGCCSSTPPLPAGPPPLSDSVHVLLSERHESKFHQRLRLWAS